MSVQVPEMKQDYQLVPDDFIRFPVWIGVHNYDTDESWYEEADEQTVRPWLGSLPFDQDRGTALAAATFTLADGSAYRGFCRAVRTDWDVPEEIFSGGRIKKLSWSRMHGGGKQSVLALQDPIIFIDGHQFDFFLGVPGAREGKVTHFYASIGKRPATVFPLQFAMDRGLATGLTSGKLGGFFRFPIWEKTFEMTTGEEMIQNIQVAESIATTNSSATCSSGKPETQFARLVRLHEFTADDFKEHPVWVRVLTEDERPRYRYAFVPSLGLLPIDSKKDRVRLSALFTLNDGSQYFGHIAPVLEDTPSGPSHDAIREHYPVMFVKGREFPFWCHLWHTVDEVRVPLYKILRKSTSEIFPIRFEGTSGLASGIVSGEIKGFYDLEFGKRRPKVVR